MSDTLLQESRRQLEELRSQAQQLAVQEAVAHASAEIQARAALLFENSLGQAAPVSTTPPDTQWEALVNELLASNPAGEGLGAGEHGTEVTKTTIEVDVPDAAVTQALGKGTIPEPTQGGPATISPATSDATGADYPTTDTPVRDLMGVPDHELVGHFLDAPDDQNIEIMPATQQPENNAPRSFEDILREAIGDVDGAAFGEMKEEESDEMHDEMHDEVPGGGHHEMHDEMPGEGAPAGVPADVDELAEAIAALGAPSMDEAFGDNMRAATAQSQNMAGESRRDAGMGKLHPSAESAKEHSENSTRLARLGRRANGDEETPDHQRRYLPEDDSSGAGAVETPLMEKCETPMEEGSEKEMKADMGKKMAMPIQLRMALKKGKKMDEDCDEMDESMLDEDCEEAMPLSESQVAVLRKDFEILNEGVMQLAAENKNQQLEIQQLKEALGLKTGQLNTVKQYLNEAITMTAKTGLANQLLVENTTTREQKKLILEALAETTSRQEAEAVYSSLKLKLEKNTLLSEQNGALRQVERVFSSEPGMLQEAANQAPVEELNPMVARWAANMNYKAK
jgi:hypothetical protein